jgi:hypothetical protein
VADTTCGRVRAVLADAIAGHPVDAGDPAWSSLVGHGAVGGTPERPSITDVGRHVLKELEVRASRTDPLPLETVAGELGRVAGDLDAVAKTAEYFLAELGPVTPPEAVPLLRPVAVELANRRETPEELAAEFRNVWGSVEVMGGDARDRLLAAELLTASDASMEAVYAPLMSTTIRLREEYGTRDDAVVSATLLQLYPDASGAPALASFATLRSAGCSAAEAGLLASLGPSAVGTLAQRETVGRALSAAGVRAADTPRAASFLLAAGATPEGVTSRTVELRRLLGERAAGGGVTPLAVLSSIEWLEPAEIANWVEKATAFARARQLAPTPAELDALGVALVHGLPRSEFLGGPPDTSGGPGSSRARSAAILALHAWVYRSLVRGAAREPAGIAPA